MTEYGMGDEETINEVLDDVDTDKVSNLASAINFKNSKPNAFLKCVTSWSKAPCLFLTGQIKNLG